MATQFPDDPLPARRPLRTTLAVGALAFLIGLALMAWALTRWEPAKRFVAGNVTQAPPVALPIVPLSAGPQVTVPTTGQAQAIDLRVAELEGRMARIDLRAAGAATNAARAEGLLVAFAARRAIDRGAALGYIEGQLRERFAESQPRAVAAIIAAAQAPVTIEGLRQGLDALAPSLTNDAQTKGWWESTTDTLGALFVVRREGTGSPAPDERLTRARLRLDAGEVDGALTEVARLPGRANAQGWMAGARRYIEAQRALDLIEASVIMAPPVPVGLAP